MALLSKHIRVLSIVAVRSKLALNSALVCLLIMLTAGSILEEKRLSIVAFLSKHTRTRFRARATVVLFSVSLQAVLLSFYSSSVFFS